METSLFVKLVNVTEACRDENGKQFAIPLLGTVKIIDNEPYCYVESFVDQFANEVSEETAKKILKKLKYQIS